MPNTHTHSWPSRGEGLASEYIRDVRPWRHCSKYGVFCRCGAMMCTVPECEEACVELPPWYEGNYVDMCKEHTLAKLSKDLAYEVSRQSKDAQSVADEIAAIEAADEMRVP